MKAKASYKIPFNSNGDMCTYASTWDKVEWKDNCEWEDNLEYESFGRGRSAVHIYFRSLITGNKYTMFMTDFHDIIKDMVTGRVSGTFTFQKRGANYGMRRV
jgi:hypothetical protein